MTKKLKSTRSLKEVMDVWTEKSNQVVVKEQLEDSNKIVKLPFCKDSERTIPNIIARSALFGVIKRGVRTYKDMELIASRGDVKVYYTGKTLDQADCSVWMQALAYAKSLGQDTPVNRAGFLKLLGKTTGKKDYLWLNSSLQRLMTGVVIIEAKTYKLEFHLIDIWGEFREKDVSEYLININPKVVKMWANSEYTQVEWEKRLAIRRGGDLTNWMQLYIRSNANNGKFHHISLVNLKNWCGLSKMRIDHFREAMKKSLFELVRVGEIHDARVRNDDMVLFVRNQNDRDSNTIIDRHSLPDDRDSNTKNDRDSNTKNDRDSNTKNDRDSNTKNDRDSNTNDRDSNTNDRDSNTNDRDSNTTPKNKSLFLKRILSLFSS